MMELQDQLIAAANGLNLFTTTYNEVVLQAV